MIQNEQIGGVLTKHFWKKNDFKVENLKNMYHFSSTILTLFYLISRRYTKKKNQMKMHCVSHVVKGTVYILQ